MKEINSKQNQRSIRLWGIVRLFIPLAVGIALGAFLYPRLAGTIRSPHSSNGEVLKSDRPVNAEKP